MFEEDYEDHDPENMPPRPPVWWRIVAAFESTFETISERGAEIVELVEPLFFVALSWLMFAVSPWRWFRKDAELDFLSDIDSAPPPDDSVGPTQGRLDAIRYSVVSSLTQVFETISGTVATLAERFMPRRIFWPLYWLLDTFFVAYDFSSDWWFSRDFQRLLWSVPAVLLGLSLGASALLGFLQPDQKKVRHYHTVMTDADASDNFQKKALARRRLEQLGYEHLDDTDFHRAIELAKSEEHQAAYEIMQKLASTEEAGFLPAHLWIAGSLLDGLLNPDGDLLEETQAHVNHALELAPDNKLARRFNVELQVRQSKIDKQLLAEMESLSEEQTDLHAALAHEYRKLGDTAASVKAARAAVRDYEKRYRARSSTDNQAPTHSLTPLGWLRIAEAYMLVGDQESEKRVLDEAIEAFPDSAELQRVSHLRNIREFNGVRLEDKRAAELAKAICNTDRKNPEVVRRLMRGLTSENDESLTTTAAKQQVSAAWKLVRELQEDGLLATEVLVFAGDSQLINQRPQDAVPFYAEACRVDPEASYAWNNLASIWSTSAPYRFEQALKAANRAIELNPDPRFYDTRGQIFVKVKRWQDAINDLEFAVSGTIPNAADAHRSLVKCYNAIGQRELADAHRKMLASFE